MIRKRWEKKKEHLEKLSTSLRSLRNNLTRDLKDADEKTRLTALVISLMDCTAERVGNEQSEKIGHYGVTGLKKNHVKINGNTITLDYVGKSGMEQEKSFSDELIAGVLKKAIKDSPSMNVFVTSDGFKIKADKVNRYLKEYDITAKDIRGYCANKYIISHLKKQEEEADPKKRKKNFNKAIKYASSKVGHGSSTLKNHYLIPELQDEYVKRGKLIDLNTFYSKGGVLSRGPVIDGWGGLSLFLRQEVTLKDIFS